MIHGVLTALVTPFTKKKEIDWVAYLKILALQANAKINGVVSCGTTGESCSLSISEKKNLIQATLDFFKKNKQHTNIKVIAATGSSNATETLALSKWASEQGVDGIQVVTPYYNRPSPLGLESHFLKIADTVSCPIILYNVPKRTGVSLTPGCIARLSKHPRIRYLKEASGNLPVISAIFNAIAHSYKLKQPKQKVPFHIFSGDDMHFLPALCLGATGIISVTSHLFPKEMLSLYHCAMENKKQEALDLHTKLYPVFRDLFIESNPVPLKFALSLFGICENTVREPLAPLTKKNKDILKATLSLYSPFLGDVS